MIASPPDNSGRRTCSEAGRDPAGYFGGGANGRGIRQEGARGLPVAAGCCIAQPILLGGRGGDVTVERLAREMARLYWDSDFVTSLVDFYGFRGKGSATVDELEQIVDEKVNDNMRRSWDQSRVFSYVQQHEFEGLLFSDVSAFASLISVPDDAVDALREIRSQFPTPEHINDNSNTAPSKRIVKLIPRYQKVVDGSLLAEEIGLETIRAACPRFNAWVTRLEALG